MLRTRRLAPLWVLGLASLAAVRQGPIAGPTPTERPGARSLTLDLTFLAAASSRRALLVHHGALPRAGVGPGAAWAVALREWRVEVDAFAHGRAWRSGRLRGWQRLLVFLDVTADGCVTPHGAELIGGERAARGLRAVTPAAWDDVHGDLPQISGLVVGGLRDLAGGHTNLRYGERRGEIIARLALWEGSPPEPSMPSASSVGGPVTVSVAQCDTGVRFVCRGVRPGDQVVWDFEDEIVPGSVALRPRALVRSAPRVYVIPEGGTPVRVAAPRSLPGARPVPVFRPGDGGYAGFRIPAIVRAQGGALLAFAEGRRELISDSCRTKDLVVRRSDDGGRRWGPLRVAAAAPDGNGARSLMNPSPVVDTVAAVGQMNQLVAQPPVVDGVVVVDREEHGAPRAAKVARRQGSHVRSSPRAVVANRGPYDTHGAGAMEPFAASPSRGAAEPRKESG